MNRKPFGLLTLGLMLMAVGCSSTDSDTKEGDLNDPLFVQTKPQLEVAIAQAIGAMDQAMDFSFNAPSDTVAPIMRGRGHISAAAAVDTFSYSYDAVSGWHVAFAAFSDSGVAGSILDSVQFRDASSQFQQNFDSATTDFIWVKQHLDVNTDDTTWIQADIGADFDMNLVGLTGALVTADGTAGIAFSTTFADSVNTCNIDFNFAETVGSVQFTKPTSDLDGVCPTGGTVNLVGTVSAACTGGQDSFSYSESWEVTATFNNNGTMDVTAQSGNTVWTYSGTTPCGNYSSPI